MNIEDKALNWLIKSGIGMGQTIKRGLIYNPDFETMDGQGFEVKTCYGNKYFKHRREESGIIYFSSMKQWIELSEHPNCQILVFGEGKEPIAIIPMSELPMGTQTWNDFSIRVAHTYPKAVERAVKKNNTAKGD